MHRIGWLASLMAVAMVLVPARAEDKITESAYYPLKVGSTWTYKIADAPAGTPSVVMKITKHEKVGDVMCARLETFVNDKSMGNEHIAITKDGIVRVSAFGFNADPPIMILKLPAKKGDTWKIESKVGTETLKGEAKVSEENVSVPAGKYDTIVATATITAGPQKIETTTCFAKNVGIVRMKMTGLAAGKAVVMELEKFEAGK
jgi:hypothetical protein